MFVFVCVCVCVCVFGLQWLVLLGKKREGEIGLTDKWAGRPGRQAWRREVAPGQAEPERCWSRGGRGAGGEQARQGPPGTCNTIRGAWT